jgi:hypothetical protein
VQNEGYYLMRKSVIYTGHIALLQVYDGLALGCGNKTAYRIFGSNHFENRGDREIRYDIE